MVDEQRLDDLYEIYTRLESLAEDIYSKDLINEIRANADLFRQEYEELQAEEEEQWDEENKQRDRDFDAGRI